MANTEPEYKTALITGASAGLGAEFARELAASGVDLILVARRKERLDALAAELREKNGIAVDVIVADLSKPEESQALAGKIAANGTIELLINNAGFGGTSRFFIDNPESSEAMVQVHVVAPILLSRAALPAMIARGKGAIINVSSVAAYSPISGAMYSSTKAFLLMFSENLKTELRDTGVKVQALCPGFTHTEFHETAGFRESDIPERMWMTAAKVVQTSLKALAGNKVRIVPGFKNKFVVLVMRCPLTSGLAGAIARTGFFRKRSGR